MFYIEFSSLSNADLAELALKRLTESIEEWEKNIWQFISDLVNPSISSIKVFTSGSTGAPKEIEHSKQAMLNSAAATCKALQLQAHNTALLCLPVNKIGGMMMVVRAMHCRLNLYCLKPSANPLKELPDELKIDFAAFTPMQLHGLENDYAFFRKAERIEKIILGGENTPAELLQNISRLLNRVYATFGMTETVSHIALKKLNGKDADAHFHVLDGIKISADENDCLVIEAPALGQPHLVTNDIIRMISTNQFDWLGRTDNVINSGGVKIHPEEIEQKLQYHIQPAFFCGALPDVRTGEKLVLAIEMENLSNKDKQELIQVLSGLDKLKRPKSILLFDRFERTGTGKIKRKETLQNHFESVDLF
jgi:O-succinylbenzoic acid--CoA ligase